MPKKKVERARNHFLFYANRAPGLMAKRISLLSPNFRILMMLLLSSVSHIGKQTIRLSLLGESDEVVDFTEACMREKFNKEKKLSVNSCSFDFTRSYRSHVCLSVTINCLSCSAMPRGCKGCLCCCCCCC